MNIIFIFFINIFIVSLNYILLAYASRIKNDDNEKYKNFNKRNYNLNFLFKKKENYLF